MKHLNFAEKQSNKPLKYWANIVWSDETIVPLVACIINTMPTGMHHQGLGVSACDTGTLQDEGKMCRDIPDSEEMTVDVQKGNY